MSTSSADNVSSVNPTLNAFNEIIDFLVSELKVNNEKSSALRSRVGEMLKSFTPAKTEKKTTTRKSKKDAVDCKLCQYEFGKRSKTPGEKCGGKVCSESTSGLYCKKHLKQEKPEEKAPAKSSDKKEKKEPKAKAAKGKTEVKEAPVIQTLKDSAPVLSVQKNRFGNYAHEGTGFLFDKKSQKVFGRQKPDGSIVSLTAEDVETCRSMGFDFEMPVNMTSKEDKQAEDDDDEELEEEEEDDEDEEDS
jgi:hypothetical protein